MGRNPRNNNQNGIEEMKKKQPPVIVQWLFSRFTNSHKKNTIIGDMEEYFYELIKEKGKIKAGLWYWLQVLKSVPVFIRNSLYWSVAMFKNYLKISLRKFVPS